MFPWRDTAILRYGHLFHDPVFVFLLEMQFLTHKRLERGTLFFVVLTAFLFRYYAAGNVPYNYDEAKMVEWIKTISLCPGTIHLPLGSEITQNPPLLPYLMKLSFLCLGVSPLTARLPSVLFGTLTLPIFYFMMKRYLNQRAALISVLFLAFSHFHIGFTRIANENAILLFFVTVIISLTQKTRLSRKRRDFVWLAIVLGMGLWVKLTLIAILPPLIYYLFVDSNSHGISSRKNFAVFILIIGAALLPNLYWNSQHQYVNYVSYIEKIDLLSLSLVPWALYFGEIIVWGMRDFDDSIFDWLFSYEYPFMNWVLALLCFGGAYYFMRTRRNLFIKLNLEIFLFNILVFSLIRPRTGGGYPVHLDNYWWAIVSVIPALILGAAMLGELSDRYKVVRGFMPLLLVYFIVNAIFFVTFPANCCVPRKSVQLKELLRTAKDYSQAKEMAKARKVMLYVERHYFNPNIN